MFCTGLASLALLPPFEGFDEAEYWSAIQQYADTGVLPRYPAAQLAADVTAYPGPYPASSGQPYQAYFAAPHHRLAGTGPTHYAAAGPGLLNYEAQHPPLFLILMRPIYRLAAGLSWPAHFFVLRLVNWCAAFAGFCAGALATRAVLRRRGFPPFITLLPMLWPYLFPQFFAEFARITNDSLCFALLSLLWWLLVRRLQTGPGWRSSLALALVLGLGLLTKAFFLPVTLGVACLLLAASRGRLEILQALGVPLLALAVGGWWYIHAMLATHNVTGLYDFVQLQHQGGFAASAARHFPTLQARLLRAPSLYLAGLFRMALGFCWAGSWSFMHPPRWLFLPILALALLPAALYLGRLRGMDLLARAPLFIIAPVALGLLFHLAGMLAQTGQGGGTPGWFFHLFAGPLSLALAIGWGRRAIMLPLLAYAGLMDALLAWMQPAFFSACLPRSGLAAVNPLHAACFISLPHLRLLCYPDAGFACLALGVAALGAGLALARA